MDEELLEFRAEFCEEAAESLATAQAALQAAVADPAVRTSSFEDAFRQLHSIKGVAAALGLDQIRELAHEAESLLAALKDPERQLGDEAVEPLSGAFALLSDMVSALSDGSALDTYAEPVADAKAVLEAVLAVSPADHDVAGQLALIERALEAARTGTASQGMLDTAVEALAGLRRKLAPIVEEEPAELDVVLGARSEVVSESSADAPSEPKVEPLREPGKDTPKTNKEYVRIELGRVDRVFNLVGELLAKVDRNSQTDATDPMQRVTTELHGAALGLRMVPMEPTFRRLRRVVNDTARLLGRDIQLEMEGMETEVDRTVAQGITDPLVHIVRNAIDHGIEPSAVRLAAGKPPSGRLKISARQKAGEVELAIEDDGKGIDPHEMLLAAKRKGVVSGSAVLDRAACFRLLFASGFSTAKQVSEVSGRGVGMDVVRKNVEAMRGTIDVESEIGVGSRFTIRLPLSLSSMEAMFFRVGGGVFAVPMHSVHGVIRMSDHTMVTAHGRAVSLRVRDTLYPFVHVLDPNEGAHSGLVIEDRDRRAVLPVDHVLGPSATVVKSLGGYIGTVPRLAGCTTMKSGEIALLLDPRPMMDAVFGLAAVAA